MEPIAQRQGQRRARTTDDFDIPRPAGLLNVPRQAGGINRPAGNLRLENAEDMQIHRDGIAAMNLEASQAQLEHAQEAARAAIQERVAQRERERVRAQEVNRLSAGLINRVVSEEGEMQGYDVSAIQQMHQTAATINGYIEGNYEGVFQHMEDEYRGDLTLERAFQERAGVTGKVGNQIMEDGRNEYAAIPALQERLREEHSPVERLIIQEEIIGRRNEGLRKVSSLQTNNKEDRIRGKRDIDLSEQIELGALYESELQKLERERDPEHEGRYRTAAIASYAQTLKEKLEKTQDRIKELEKSGYDDDLGLKLSRSYRGGEVIFQEEYDAMSAQISRPINAADIQHQTELQTSIAAYNPGEAGMQMTCKESEDHQIIVEKDTIAEKYDRLLKTNFETADSVRLAWNYMLMMHQDVDALKKTKKEKYKSEEDLLKVLKSEKEEIEKNVQLTPEEKEAQIKEKEEAIKKKQKELDIIEAEMSKLLVYDFFYERMDKLKEYLFDRSIPHLLVEKSKVFKGNSFSFQNYDTSEIGQIRMLVRKHRELGLEGLPAFGSLDEKQFNDLDKKYIRAYRERRDNLAHERVQENGGVV